MAEPLQRHDPLAEWQGRPVPVPRRLLPQRIFEQAARSPRATALVSAAGEELSYRQLAERAAAGADRLARRLAGRSIGRLTKLPRGAAGEPVVAILARRDTDLWLGALSIWSAGAVYLPLDPAAPAERAAELAARAGAALIVVDGENRKRLVDALAAASPLAAEGPAAPPLVDLAALVAPPADPAATPAPPSPTPPSPTPPSPTPPSPTPPSPTTPAPTTPAPAARLTADSLAYVLFTSGSTGRPKGAMVTHGGMINHLLAKVEELALDAADRVAQTASQCFDISLWQLLAPLLAGGRAVLAGEEERRDPVALAALVEERGVTVLEVVPSLLAAALAVEELAVEELAVEELAVEEPPAEELSTGDRGPRRAGALPAPDAPLRWLLVTGEACPSPLWRRWHELRPAVPAMNAYGPTECADDVSHFTGPLPAGQELAAVPLGRALRGTRLYVVDRDLRLLPPGSAGELCVAGVGVGRGYLGDPARTAATFVPDPFDDGSSSELGGEPGGGRLYRTGDRVRRLPDGGLEFLGRLDDQVKLRGHRVEPGEIEAALLEQPGVAAAAVVLSPAAGGDECLTAWVVPAPPAADSEGAGGGGDHSGDYSGDHGVGFSARRLRSALADRLPAYMVPAHVVPLAALPLNRNGKVDRRALARRALPAAGPAEAPPVTATEKRLAAHWQQLLGLDSVRQVDIHTSFFDLGGSSLLLFELHRRVGRETAAPLNLLDLYQHPTVSALARLLDGDSSGGDSSGGDPSGGAPSGGAPSGGAPSGGDLEEQRQLSTASRVRARNEPPAIPFQPPRQRAADRRRRRAGRRLAARGGRAPAGASTTGDEP